MLRSRFRVTISSAFARSSKHVYAPLPFLRNGACGKECVVYSTKSVNASTAQNKAENHATNIIHEEIRKVSDASNEKEGTKTASATTEIYEMECVQQKLTSVGAETSQILTIADVLAAQASNDEGIKAIHNYGTWKSISHDKTVQDAVSMMVTNKVGVLLVTQDSLGVVGIITERDLLKKISPRTYFQKKALIKDVMSSHVMCIPTTMTIIDTLSTMIKENFRHLVVISGNSNLNTVQQGNVPIDSMRSVLSIKDIIRAYSEMEAYKAENAKLKPSFEGKTNANDKSAENAEADSNSLAGEEKANKKTTTPQVTAALMLKQKHTKNKLILNTRVDDNISVAEAVEAMVRHDFGSVLIVDKDQCVHGIFTEQDYLVKVLNEKRDPNEVLVTDMCTKVVSRLHVDDTLEVCWKKAVSKPFRHFPVTGVTRKDRPECELAGILSIKDIVHEIFKGHQTTRGFWLVDFFKSRREAKEPEKASNSSRQNQQVHLLRNEKL